MEKELFIKEIRPGVYLMDEAHEATGYLVTGAERACVIDTMNGYNNLQEAVRKLILTAPLTARIISTASETRLQIPLHIIATRAAVRTVLSIRSSFMETRFRPMRIRSECAGRTMKATATVCRFPRILLRSVRMMQRISRLR